MFGYILSDELGKSFLRMVEVILESVPQLYLQAYIICQRAPEVDFNGGRFSSIITRISTH